MERKVFQLGEVDVDGGIRVPSLLGEGEREGAWNLGQRHDSRW